MAVRPQDWKLDMAEWLHCARGVFDWQVQSVLSVVVNQLPMLPILHTIINHCSAYSHFPVDECTDSKHSLHIS